MLRFWKNNIILSISGYLEKVRKKEILYNSYYVRWDKIILYEMMFIIYV